nr:MAG TPA: peptidoglycan hydrolase [Caudoviricetes sp.]
MAYTNSPMVSYTKLSPSHSGQRTHSIDRITPHCVVGQCSVETLGNIFSPVSRQASSNYGIGPDGRVGMYVEEKNRSWCSSSNANDQRAVTIECASDTTEPYAFRDVVYQTLIKLCVDICKRNGKTKLLWLGDKTKTLSYTPKPDEMVLTVHRWFANKSCPGNWMYARMGDLAKKVTAALGGNTNPAKPGKPSATIKVGDLVTITGSTYYNGKSIPKWVKGKNWYVLQTDGARVVIDKSEDGKNAICSPVNAADLQLVNAKPGKTVDELAREVIRGLWGNGTERKNRLTEAGYDYRAVQRRVNELLR